MLSSVSAFGTWQTGHGTSDLRRDVLRPAIKAADAKLAEDDIAPIGPEPPGAAVRSTPGGLRSAIEWARMGAGSTEDVRVAAPEAFVTD